MKDKGNDGKGNIESRDLWQTKQELFDLLDSQYNFTFDCCASEENKKCSKFSNDFLSVNSDSLKEDICWMNPPFSKARIMFEHFFKTIKRGVAIFRIDNPETKIWQEIIFPHASWVFIPKGRVSYTPFDIDMRGGNGTRFPSALIGFNVAPIESLEGITLKPSVSTLPSAKEHNKDLTATQQVASPKSASQTSLNSDIHRNFPFALQCRVQSLHLIKMLPLTLQSEIGTSNNTLIKGNC